MSTENYKAEYYWVVIYNDKHNGEATCIELYGKSNEIDAYMSLRKPEITNYRKFIIFDEEEMENENG